MHTKLLTTTGLIVVLALFLAVNIVSNTLFKTSRLDLTEGKLYTLSEGTKNILKSLGEPITLRFYLSQKLVTQLPGMSSYALRVQELLQEYQRYAGSKLKLQNLDPEPFSEEEDRAEGYGLQGVPINDSNTSFYFGLAGSNSTDDEQVIPFFSPNREEFLEYDITKLIYHLTNPKQKVVSVMSSLPLQGDPMAALMSNATPSWMIIDHLKQLFDIRTLSLDVDKIPEETNVLMVVHPKNLSDTTLYAIDQFILKGGRAIVFVDPYSEADQPMKDPKNPLSSLQAPRDSNLRKLFDTWGIELATDKVVGDMQVAERVQIRKGASARIITYPVWMDLNKEDYFNKKDIITNKLGNVVLATAGVLEKKGSVGTEITPLIESSEQAMLIPTDKLGFLADPEELGRDFKPEGKKFAMAVRITGKLKTAFPDGKPKAEEKSEETKEAPQPEAPHLKESKDSVNLIVVADTDLLADQFWVRVQNFFGQRLAIPQAANATFVSNALDNLTGSNDLISVRNRGSFTRPFTKVQAIQQAAEQRFREKEKDLLARLQETEKKINDLQSQKQAGNALVLSAEQRQEIERFRNEKIKIRKELRNVQHELQKDIEQLESQMKAINIGLIPLVIGIGGIGFGFYRSRRKRGIPSTTT